MRVKYYCVSDENQIIFTYSRGHIGSIIQAMWQYFALFHQYGSDIFVMWNLSYLSDYSVPKGFIYQSR